MKKYLFLAVMSVFALAASADSWESGLEICSTKVTSSNVDDLLSLFSDQEHIRGTLSYDNETGVLTLNELAVDRKNAFPTFFRFTKTTDRSEYYVKINGNCIFDNKGVKAKNIFFVEEGVTVIFDGIHGDPAEDEIDFYTGNAIGGSTDATIRIKNLTIEHNEIIFTLCGNGSSYRMSELSIINCNIKAEDESGIFENIKSFKLINCAFVTPADATFNTEKYYVESEGARLLHVPVEIKAKKTAIDNVNQEAHIKNQKVIRNGQMLIERNGELFNLTGAKMQ